MRECKDVLITSLKNVLQDKQANHHGELCGLPAALGISRNAQPFFAAGGRGRLPYLHSIDLVGTKRMLTEAIILFELPPEPPPPAQKLSQSLPNQTPASLYLGNL